MKDKEIASRISHIVSKIIKYQERLESIEIELVNIKSVNIDGLYNKDECVNHLSNISLEKSKMIKDIECCLEILG